MAGAFLCTNFFSSPEPPAFFWAFPVSQSFFPTTLFFDLFTPSRLTFLHLWLPTHCLFNLYLSINTMSTSPITVHILERTPVSHCINCTVYRIGAGYYIRPRRPAPRLRACIFATTGEFLKPSDPMLHSHFSLPFTLIGQAVKIFSNVPMG